MKIGVITSAYPEFEDDPHGIFVHRLMKEIQKRGHDVKVLAPFTSGETEYVLDGVHVEKFHYFYPKRFQKLCGRAGMVDNVKDGFLVKLQVLPFVLFNTLNSLRKMHDVDLIHVQWPIPNGLGAFFLKKIYKIPYINTIHGEEVYLSKRYHMLYFLRSLVNNSVKSVTNSSGTLRTCLDSGLKEDKFEVIPFGVDTSFFRPIDVDKDENTFQILAVGYLIERKGFEYLIKAMKNVLEKHENVYLRIVGSGPLEKRLKNLIKDLDLNENVEIIKNVSDDGLLKIYNSSDLFVLPSVVDSQGNTEGLGVVLLEAMACKLPVIGSDVGGIPDIIQDGETGLLVSQKYVNGISTSVTNLIENESLREKIAFNGYTMVKERFSWKKIVENYLNVYNQVLII